MIISFQNIEIKNDTIPIGQGADKTQQFFRSEMVESLGFDRRLPTYIVADG